MFDIGVLKKSVAGLSERLASIATDIEATQRKRDSIVNAPAHRSDVKAMLDAWVTAMGAGFNNDMGTTLKQFIARPGLLSQVPRLNTLSLVTPADPYSGTINASDMNKALCAIFRDQVIDALHDCVDAAEWPSEGLPMSERGNASAGLDAKLNELRTEEAALREQAAQLGIIQI